jgi:hypothetical protein
MICFSSSSERTRSSLNEDIRRAPRRRRPLPFRPFFIGFSTFNLPPIRGQARESENRRSLPACLLSYPEISTRANLPPDYCARECTLATTAICAWRAASTRCSHRTPRPVSPATRSRARERVPTGSRPKDCSRQPIACSPSRSRQAQSRAFPNPVFRPDWGGDGMDPRPHIYGLAMGQE